MAASGRDGNSLCARFGGRMLIKKRTWLSAAALTLLLATASSAQVNEDMAVNGWSMEQNRSAAWHLAQHQKLSKAIAKIAPQRPGIIDAYVVAIGFDSDPVFKKEAGEALKVLERRYGAAGRSLLLTSGSGTDASDPPQGSPANLATALAAIAAKMNVKEDVLILYATTHGDPKLGLVYRDGEKGFGMIAPKRMKSLFGDLSIERRVLLLSACYSGVFVGEMAGKDTAIITAASSFRPSFGCTPGNDWTFFGDALINNALRKPQAFAKAAEEATGLIATWEAKMALQPSNPQVWVGEDAEKWLPLLEARIPATETPKVGRPAMETTFQLEQIRPIAVRPE
jgi:Peptidase C13 family